MTETYVINLESSPERRAWMECELARAGVSGEFVRAIDGRRLGPGFERRLRERETVYRLSKYEAACTLSHRKVWRRFLASGASHAIILEDDVRLGSSFARAATFDWSRLNFDIVKLETMSDKVWLAKASEAFEQRRIHRLLSGHLGAAGYVVSAAGARKLLQLTQRTVQPVDHTMFGAAAICAGRLRVLQLVPAIAMQCRLRAPAAAGSVLKSSLEMQRGSLLSSIYRGEISFRRRLVRETKRIFEQARDLLYRGPIQLRRRIGFE